MISDLTECDVLRWRRRRRWWLQRGVKDGRPIAEQLRTTVAGGWAPLHLAAGGNSSVEVVKWLTNHEPEQLWLRTDAACIPMHAAAQFSQSVGVVRCEPGCLGSPPMPAPTTAGKTAVKRGAVSPSTVR